MSKLNFIRYCLKIYYLQIRAWELDKNCAVVIFVSFFNVCVFEWMIRESDFYFLITVTISVIVLFLFISHYFENHFYVENLFMYNLNAQVKNKGYEYSNKLYVQYIVYIVISYFPQSSVSFGNYYVCITLFWH